MAEGQVKQMLEKEVTCALCLDLFKEPKKLPCDHVYCRDCLRSLALRSINATISCPECRTATQVPGNVNNFPTAFRVNRLIEAFQQVQVRVETDSPNVTEMCQVHPAQQLAIYCETCKKRLCRDCILMTKEHASHEYGFFEEVAPKHREKIISKLSQIKAQKSSISSALEEIAAAENSIADGAQLQECEDDVEHAFEELFSILQTCKQAMKDEATAYYSSLAGVFDQQKEQLKDIQSKIELVVASVDTTLQDDDQDFLVRLKSTFERISNLQMKIKGVSVAVTKPQLTQSIDSDAFKQFIKTNCFFYKKAHAEMCSLDSSFVDVKFYVGKQASFILNLCDSRGNVYQEESGVDVNMVNLRDATCTIQGNLKLLQSGRAKIFFTPEMRGRYQVNVKVNGDHIKNSPFIVTVYVHPNLLSKPVAEIAGLSRPCGLRCSREKVLATEVGKGRIIEIDSLLSAKEFKKLPGAYELTQDLDHNLYVTNDKCHQLIKLNSAGNVIKVVGKLGKGNAEFHYPNGLRVSKNNELYVCDSYNNRVQVFDLDLNFKQSFGKKGTGKGQFDFPADVNLDSTGNIYVTDVSNHRIQVFSPQSERHIHTIQGDAVFRPVSLFTHGNYMYVTDDGHHEVKVIDTESREFISKFGNEYLLQSEGVTIDKDGFVYVTSHHSKIVIF